MSFALMCGLGFVYVIIMVACLIEKRYDDALYWFGAGIITLSLVLRRVA
jgi:hypothetical protein